MKFHTYNGVFAEEKKLGQKLEIDVDMQYPIEERNRGQSAFKKDFSRLPKLAAGYFKNSQIQCAD